MMKKKALILTMCSLLGCTIMQAYDHRAEQGVHIIQARPILNDVVITAALSTMGFSDVANAPEPQTAVVAPKAARTVTVKEHGFDNAFRRAVKNRRSKGKGLFE